MRQDHRNDEDRLPSIFVYGMTDAVAALRAAAEAGRAVRLECPAEVVVALGPTVVRQLFAISHSEVPAARADWIVDCRDYAGLAMAAIRAGLPAVRVTLSDDLRRRLADIAKHSACRIEGDSPGISALDLADAPDPLAACREWLASPGIGGSDGPKGALPSRNRSCI